MSSPVSVPRVWSAGFGGVLALLLLAGPLVAQEKMGGQAFRTSLGASLLMPMDESAMAMAADRLPSGRAALEIQANPVFGFHFGALRLAPNLMWAEGEPLHQFGEPASKVALTAGLVGFRLNFATGRVRFGPFVDGGFGQVQARVDQGGYEYEQSGQRGYQPMFVDTVGFMAGGGGGAVLDLILGPGLTLSMIGGYWHFVSVGDDDAASPAVDPISGLFAGLGAKLSFRSAPYYWRHSGKDTNPPVIAILSPTPIEAGVVDVGGPQTTLSLRLAALSGVDSLFVNGDRVRLIPGGRAEDGAVVVNAAVPLQLHPGPNEISYLAYSGAGLATAGSWEVRGVPLDKEGPVITILQPEDDVTITSERLVVEAIIRDRSPIRQVTVDGLSINPAQATPEQRALVEAAEGDFVVRIQSTTNVVSATQTITVAAVDSANNNSIKAVTVRRAGVAVAQQPAAAPQALASRGPEIDIHRPTEWSGAGTRGFQARPMQSINLAGSVRYQEGVREVLANNRRLALRRDENNPAVVQFSGFVEPPPPGSGGEVEIVALGMDGRQTVLTLSARTAEPAPAAAAAPPPARFEALAGARNRQRWVVIIGIDDYQDPKIENLRYAAADAQAMYEFFRSPAAGMGGVPESNIRRLINEQATARQIRSALTTFLRGSTDDDVIFIYIAGHGAPDPLRMEQLYILAHDTEMDDIAATGVSMDLVNESIRSAYAYNKVLITDACHSAGVAGTRGANSAALLNSAFMDYMNNSSGGFVVFTASQASQLSQERAEYGHGVFTHYLLQGLRGEADRPEFGGDGDGIVTLVELMEYTRDRVRRETSNGQIPSISPTAYDPYWPMSIIGLDGR